MYKYKLINGVLHKNDIVCLCPEKGVVPVTQIEQRQGNLALSDNKPPQVITSLQQFPCMENCARFVKTFTEVGGTEGRLACCINVCFKIESETVTTPPPAKNKSYN